MIRSIITPMGQRLSSVGDLTLYGMSIIYAVGFRHRYTWPDEKPLDCVDIPATLHKSGVSYRLDDNGDYVIIPKDKS